MKRLFLYCTLALGWAIPSALRAEFVTQVTGESGGFRTGFFHLGASPPVGDTLSSGLPEDSAIYSINGKTPPLFSTVADFTWAFGISQASSSDTGTTYDFSGFYGELILNSFSANLRGGGIFDVTSMTGFLSALGALELSGDLRTRSSFGPDLDFSGFNLGGTYTIEVFGSDWNQVFSQGHSGRVSVISKFTITASPEPSSLTLLLVGTLGLIGYGWRRQKHFAA
jgi:hypothetical protein